MVARTAAGPGAADANAWPRDELLRLIQAWGQVVEPPRDREELSARELLRLHSRFEELCERRGGRRIQSMERQRLRLVTTLKRVQALDHDGVRQRRPTWLQLSREQRERLLAIDGDAVVATIDKATLRAVERVCREHPPPTDMTAATGTDTDAAETVPGGVAGPEAGASSRTLIDSSVPTDGPGSGFIGGGNSDVLGTDAEPHTRRNLEGEGEGETTAVRGGEDRTGSELAAVAEALAGLPIAQVPTGNLPPPSSLEQMRGINKATDEFYGGSPPLRWRLRDELELIRAWDHALLQRVRAIEPCFKLDELVLERYTAVCGPNEETVSSISAKRHQILGAFESLCVYLRSRPRDAPPWFSMTVSERLAEQKANGHHHQGFVCTLEAPEYGHLSSIAENERRLDQINREAERATNDSVRHDRGPFSAEGFGNPPTRRYTTDHRDQPPSRYRTAADIADSEVLVSLRHASKRRRTAYARSQQRGDLGSEFEGNSASQPSSGMPLSLVDQLVQAQSRRLELLLEEFRQERQQERQQTQELLLLLLARVDDVPRGDVEALEALVEQQRRQMEQLFDLVESEREAEWARAQELLAELEDGRWSRR